MKRCTACAEVKALDDFTRDAARKDGRASSCRACSRLRWRRWVDANPDKEAAHQARRKLDLKKERDRRRRWVAANPERARANYRRSKYGLTPERFAEFMANQGDRCAICRAALTTPIVDHNHSTGTVRGILCKSCNTALGLFGDDVGRLQVAVDYLKATA